MAEQLTEWVKGPVTVLQRGRFQVIVERAVERDRFDVERRVFVVAGFAPYGRPYQAVLRACGCDREACTRSHDGSDCRRCHGHVEKHVEHAEALAVLVLRSYGSAHRPNIPTRGGHSAMRIEHVAAAIGMTVEQYRAQIELAHGGAS